MMLKHSTSSRVPTGELLPISPFLHHYNKQPQSLAFLEIGHAFIVFILSECYPTSWLSLPATSRNVTETWDTDFIWWFARILGQLLCTCLHLPSGAGKLVGSHGSSLPLLMMKVMVWHFVTKSHKVMTALIAVLPSKCLLCRFLCNLVGMSLSEFLKIPGDLCCSWRLQFLILTSPRTWH